MKKTMKKKKVKKRKNDVQRVFQILQRKEGRFHVVTEETAAVPETIRDLKIGKTLLQQPQD